MVGGDGGSLSYGLEIIVLRNQSKRGLTQQLENDYMYVLTFNVGSSSVKYQLFDMTDESCLAKGMVESLNPDADKAKALLKHEAIGKTKCEFEAGQIDYETALKLCVDSLLDKEHGVINSTDEISAVGHRVVHGAERVSKSVLITEEIEAIIEECIPLAPLHNPYNLIGIQACKKLLPDVPHVAVFDTAFHQTMPEEAYLYAIPYEWYTKQFIRRYGFHGTSHRYVSARAAELLSKPLESLKMITCHLGNGCSITAVCNGKSVDTSMGLTPLEGLVMGTRSGDVDPGVILHLINRFGMSAGEVDNFLNRESGLKGLSGLESGDVRELRKAAANGNQRAQLALEIFCYRVKKYIGSYAAAMGGLDVLVFTAGVGENNPPLRENMCTGLEFLGIQLDKERNNSEEPEKFINTEYSKVKVLVVPTNEELLIARDTIQVLGN